MSLLDFLLAIVDPNAPDPERYSRQWWVDTVLGVPLTILLILVVALVARWLAHRGVDRLVRRIANSQERERERVPAAGRAAQVVLGESEEFSARRALRATTMGSLFKSITTAVVFAVAAVMILSALGIDVAPIIASAGILGVALGFGAQNLVKDFISGVFMLLEDQYGVGDVVDTGFGSGVVESVGLRVTRLRDVDGTVWYVRNGEVVRIGNKSQGWSRAVIDVGVAYGEDVGRVRQVLLATAEELRSDPVLGELVLADPEVWGVEQLAADSVVVRVVVKTRPLEQWRIARDYRERVKRAFDAAGIEIPFPQRTVWMRRPEETGSPDESAAATPRE